MAVSGLLSALPDKLRHSVPLAQSDPLRTPLCDNTPPDQADDFPQGIY